MKIKAIIVDKVPKSCFDCLKENGHDFCHIVFDEKNNKFLPIKYNTQRYELCPLRDVKGLRVGGISRKGKKAIGSLFESLGNCYILTGKTLDNPFSDGEFIEVLPESIEVE